jgi:hypothetical protein
MKPIAFTRHGLQQMAARRAEQGEVEQAVRWGEPRRPVVAEER